MKQQQGVDERDRYERAFVAFSYALGCRGVELTTALPAPSQVAHDLVEKLCHPKRSVRAAVLAAELARVAHALDSRRLV